MRDLAGYRVKRCARIGCARTFIINPEKGICLLCEIELLTAAVKAAAEEGLAIKEPAAYKRALDQILNIVKASGEKEKGNGAWNKNIS